MWDLPPYSVSGNVATRSEGEGTAHDNTSTQGLSTRGPGAEGGATTATVVGVPQGPQKDKVRGKKGKLKKLKEKYADQVRLGYMV